MIKFLLGPMKSGKSTKMFADMEKYLYAKKKVLFIYPDNSKREFFSRNGDDVLSKVDKVGIKFDWKLDEVYEKIKGEYDGVL